jgi:hypothetical protein
LLVVGLVVEHTTMTQELPLVAALAGTEHHLEHLVVEGLRKQRSHLIEAAVLFTQSLLVQVARLRVQIALLETQVLIRL